MLSIQIRRTVLARAVFVVVATALCVAGCRTDNSPYPKVEPVLGKVFAKGQPASGAVVMFHPIRPEGKDKPRPRAVVQPDGSFYLSTYTTGDGAAAGDYAVTLFWPEKEDPDLEARGGEVRDRLRNRFKDPQRPYKRVTVREGNNDLGRLDVE